MYQLRYYSCSNCNSARTAFGQTLSVNGKVLNDKGAPVEGASVVQKGTTNGTVSDKNGAFSIQVPRNAVLEISAVGFGKKEVNVTGSGDLTIEVLSDEKILGEIVVTGYGTQPKSGRGWCRIER